MDFERSFLYPKSAYRLFLHDGNGGSFFHSSGSRLSAAVADLGASEAIEPYLSSPLYPSAKHKASNLLVHFEFDHSGMDRKGTFHCGGDGMDFGLGKTKRFLCFLTKS